MENYTDKQNDIIAECIERNPSKWCLENIPR